MIYKSICVCGLAVFGALVGSSQPLVPLNPTPSRIVGHPLPEANGPLASATPNLVEGRELYTPEGIALDTSVSPPILYVADTNNHRVLVWQNAAGFSNGQTADFAIGQQDLLHTGAQGTGQQTGLTLPTGLAVYNGDLYIADTGNNRVVRFRKPVANKNNLFPDLFIGQPTLASKTPNYTGRVAASGIALTTSVPFVSSIAFDSSGNLWMSDPGNRRVLRFDAADVAAGGGPLTASLEIGQLDFTSVQPSVNSGTATTGNLFATPSAVAFDAAGRLYVSDTDNTANLNRVLVFTPPFSNGMAASRMMGVFPPGQPATTQDQVARTSFSSVNSIFFIPGGGGKLGLLDQGDSRILLFDAYENWPAINTSYSPQATAVIGQTSFSNFRPNGGTTFTPAASNSTFFVPTGAAVSSSELYVADTGNNRVVVLPLQGATFGQATRVLGQDRFDMMAPNLIEGKEFDFTASNNRADAGIAIDFSGDTPHLYVADTYNNRILGFKDVRQLKANAHADLVIGQQDFNSGLCNGNGDPNHITASTLCQPSGLVVDASGNLYVADSFNGRVLRFPSPFTHQGTQQADLVLGQHTFTSKITDASQFTMAYPYGLAFVVNNGLLVSDAVHNRVLFFPYTNGGFDANDSGKAASKVFGQPDFTTTTAGNSDAKMSGPHHIATDTDARPYVVDTANNRVLIFDQINTNANTGASASFILTGVNTPEGIYVSPVTGEIWVTDTNGGQVNKYPKFQSLVLSPKKDYSIQSAGATLAVTQDQYGDLVVADSTNRISLYFPGLQGLNNTSFLPSFRLAPGMLAAICSQGSNCDPSTRANIFGANTIYFADLPNPVPLPTAIDNVQVLFNGQPTALAYVSPSQVVFYVPMAAPTSGTASVEVVQSTTGRVYAAGTVGMAPYSPAVFMQSFQGKTRQASVLNADLTLNSPTNPAARGSVISIYASGQGFVAGTPPDGTPAPSSPLLNTPFNPRININLTYADEYPAAGNDPKDKNFVSFSGLAPGYVGLWQINFQIPNGVPPGAQIPLIVFAGATPSTDGTFATTIAVK